jgi:hypothetical protein
MKFEFPIRAGASLLASVALVIAAACSRPGSTAGSSALKRRPIEQSRTECGCVATSAHSYKEAIEKIDGQENNEDKTTATKAAMAEAKVSN